jgi:hypothetical protein
MVLAGLCSTCYQCRCPLQAGCFLDQNLLMVVFGRILGGCWLLLSTSLGLISTLSIYLRSDCLLVQLQGYYFSKTFVYVCEISGKEEEIKSGCMAPRPWLLPWVGDPGWPEQVILAAAAIPEQGVEPSSKCAATVTRRPTCCCCTPLTSTVTIQVFIPVSLYTYISLNFPRFMSLDIQVEDNK